MYILILGPQSHLERLATKALLLRGIFEDILFVEEVKLNDLSFLPSDYNIFGIFGSANGRVKGTVNYNVLLDALSPARNEK